MKVPEKKGKFQKKFFVESFCEFYIKIYGKKKEGVDGKYSDGSGEKE
jgi:hypothetical protein